MAINWEEFDNKVDLEGLEKDVQEASTKDFGEFEEVPEGTYEIKITKLELTQSKKGDPMVSVWFEIVGENNKGRLIFMNQLVNQGFQIHTMNEFLRSLETDEIVEFKGYSNYNILLLNIYEKIVDSEYALEYGKNKKGFKTFKILEKFTSNSSVDNNTTEVDNAAETKEELGWG